MIKLTGLNNEQVQEISRRIADAFYDYPYHEDDLGLMKYIRSRRDMHTYMDAIIQASYHSGLLYTTSEQEEGYLILSGEGVGSIGFADGMKMISAEKKALGGLRNMKSFISGYSSIRFFLNRPASVFPSIPCARYSDIR